MGCFVYGSSVKILRAGGRHKIWTCEISKSILLLYDFKKYTGEYRVIEAGIILSPALVKLPLALPQEVVVELEIVEKSEKPRLKKFKQKQKISLREIK